MASAAPPIGGAPLSGTVTEQGTNITLSGVRVVALHAATYLFAASATTNPNDGTYTLNLNPGDYKIAFIAPTGRHNGTPARTDAATTTA
jgi:hypothetical protein